MQLENCNEGQLPWSRSFSRILVDSLDNLSRAIYSVLYGLFLCFWNKTQVVLLLIAVYDFSITSPSTNYLTTLRHLVPTFHPTLGAVLI